MVRARPARWSEFQKRYHAVSRTRRGIAVNEYLQSVSSPTVYAADGGGLPLTPIASLEGDVVATNLIEGNHRKPDFSEVPSIVFTTPPLASFATGEAAGGLHGANRLGGNSLSDLSRYARCMTARVQYRSAIE